MKNKKRIVVGAFTFISIALISTSSYNAAYKTVTETLVMDNDAPSDADFSNPKSSDGQWSYYPKKSWGMNTYLKGSKHYNNDARKGLCTTPTVQREYMEGGTVYAWKWKKDNTAPGDPVTLYVKINDSSFTAPAVEYLHRDGTAYGGGQSFGTINQNSWPGSLSCVGSILLQKPSYGPYIIADGTHNKNKGHYMGADQVKYVHTYTKYVSTK